MAVRSKEPSSDGSARPDPHGMDALVADYLEWMRTGNYAERTVEDRRAYLGYFVAWCAERGVTRPREAGRPVLERYQRFLYRYRKKDGKPLSFCSQSGRLVALRMFFKWLSRQKHILYNPAAELELPRLGSRLPKHVLSASEAERVLCQVEVDTPLGVRDRAILETFYATGVRRSELLRLRVYDLDLERGTLTVRQGKGRKDRVVPVGERADNLIRRGVRNSSLFRDVARRMDDLFYGWQPAPKDIPDWMKGA